MPQKPTELNLRIEGSPSPEPQQNRPLTQADWDAATPIQIRRPSEGPPTLFNPPPPITGPPLPAHGPANWFDKATELGLELGGAMIGGGAVRGIKGFTQLPALVRGITAATGAGTGMAAGHLIDETLAPHAGPPPKLSDTLSRTRDAYVQGFAGEGAGEVIGAGMKAAGATRLGQKLRAPFASKMPATGKEATEYLEGHVTPGQVTDSHLLRVLDNIMQGSLFGGGRYRKFIGEQAQLLQRKADEILGQFGGKVPVEEAGTRYQSALEAAHKAAKDTASKLYEDVDTLAEGVKVPLNSLTEFAQQEAERRGALGMSLRGGKGMSAINKVTAAAGEEGAEVPTSLGKGFTPAGVAEAAKSNPVMASLLSAFTDAGIDTEAIEAGQVTFRQAHEIRSALGKMWRDANRTGDSQTRGIVSQLLKRISSSMGEASQAKPELTKAYDTATAAWKTMADTFEKGTLKSAAKAAPKDVVKTIITPGRVDDIVRARQAVGVDAWKNVQAAHVQSLLEAPGGGLVGGDQLAKKLAKLKPETLDAIYQRGTSADIKQFARVLQQVSAKGPSNLKMWIQLAQGGAIAGIATGVLSPKAGAVMLTPFILSRAVLNPTARKWLTLGLEASKAGDTSTAARMGGQLLAWLGKQGLLAAEAHEGQGTSTRGAPPTGPVSRPGLGGRAGGPPPGPPR